jgi:hypothetical protein
MRFRWLIVLGVAVIPFWYLYRTFEEKRVRRLEWSEVFMTEEARQKKWADEKQKVKEAAEAERVEKATQLEKSIAARKLAEAEAAKAEADVRQARTAETAELNRVRIESERRAAEAGMARLKSEAERADRQKRIALALKTCADKVGVVESRRKTFTDEQGSYVAFLDQVAATPLPEKYKNITMYGREFSSTFQMLSHEYLRGLNDGDEIQRAKETCEAAASNDETNHGYEMERVVRELEGFATRYAYQLDGMRRSRTDIRDLIDLATGKLPDNAGGQIRKARAEDAIRRSYSWKASQ